MRFSLLARLLALAALSVPSCALVTTPVKVVGKATTTTLDVTGKAVGAGLNVIGGGDDKDEE